MAPAGGPERCGWKRHGWCYACESLIRFHISHMAFLSLLCSLLLFVTGWAVLPFFVLGPLAIYLGVRSYKQSMGRNPRAGRGRRLIALMPLFTAIAAIPLTLVFISATYRA